MLRQISARARAVPPPGGDPATVATKGAADGDYDTSPDSSFHLLSDILGNSPGGAAADRDAYLARSWPSDGADAPAGSAAAGLAAGLASAAAGGKAAMWGSGASPSPVGASGGAAGAAAVLQDSADASDISELLASLALRFSVAASDGAGEGGSAGGSAPASPGGATASEAELVAAMVRRLQESGYEAATLEEVRAVFFRTCLSVLWKRCVLLIIAWCC